MAVKSRWKILLSFLTASAATSYIVWTQDILIPPQSAFPPELYLQGVIIHSLMTAIVLFVTFAGYYVVTVMYPGFLRMPYERQEVIEVIMLSTMLIMGIFFALVFIINNGVLHLNQGVNASVAPTITYYK